MYLVKHSECGYGGKPVKFTCHVTMKEVNDIETARKLAQKMKPSEIYEPAGKFPADIINPKTGHLFKIKEVV